LYQTQVLEKSFRRKGGRIREEGFGRDEAGVRGVGSNLTTVSPSLPIDLSWGGVAKPW
jgi:hypothetical protein